MDRRSVGADDPELVSVGVALVEDTIPGHEFPQPVDRVVRSSEEGVVSGDSVLFFSSSTFLMVGTIPVQFGECLVRESYKRRLWLAAYYNICSI